MPSWSMQIIADTASPALARYAQQFREAGQAKMEFGARAHYALFVEIGTRRMAARPFMRPALDGTQQKLLDAILIGALNGNVLAELDAVGQDMEDLARSIVPVATGFLRDSIYHTVS